MKNIPNKLSFLNLSGLMLIILFISSLNFSFRTFNDLNEGLITLEVYHRIAGFFILTFYVLYKSPGILKTISSNKFLLFFILYCLYRILSSSWSIMPVWSFYRSIEFMVVSMLFISLLDFKKIEGSLIYNMNRVIILYLFLFLTVLLGLLHSPGEALNIGGSSLPRLQGVIPRWNSNGIGQTSAIIVGLLFVRMAFFQKRRNDLLILLFAFTILIFTQTRSALAPFLIFSFIFFSNRSNFNQKFIIYVLFSVFSMILLFSSNFFYVLFDYVIRGQTNEQLLTLSYRLIGWQATIENANFDLFRFLFGVGSFAGGRYIGSLNFISTFESTASITLDNAWLELLIDEGVIGVIFLVIIISWIFNLLRQTDIEFIKWTGYCLLIILFFRSFFVSSILLHTNFFFLILVLIGASLEQRRKIKKAKLNLRISS